ncbi:DUF1848 domain-containing protein [candidate division CSSED10-310 bacterium]|uniref:DUF1848 domain-containing protein n=1 Tax=candidate division CSSED10-310 bacterium TaxID=2855610 RepID=A0ABV6Z2A3_UNCC1
MRSTIAAVNESSPLIISVSRRTDIPAYYSPWFEARLQDGFADYSHPFTRKRNRVLLREDSVAGFVFWSKNFQPFVRLSSMVQQRYPCYFHYTITGYGGKLEPGVPPLPDSLRTFRDLSELTTPQQMILRYDPIMFSDTLTAQYHRQRYTEIVRQLEGKSHTSIISFVQVYKKVRSALQQHGIKINVELLLQLDLAAELAEISQQHGFELAACCFPELQFVGVGMAHCISGDFFRKIYPDFQHSTRTAPTRKGCGCDFCQDIGFYNTCPNGCIYCYANANHNQARTRFQKHKLQGTSLVS